MMTVTQWEDGRAPFPLLEEDNDYSGKDFASVYLRGSKSLSHAFLNGVTIEDSAFINSELDQCEFGEAQLIKTVFAHCLLEGTDFVRATFTDVLFEDCDFTDGEWRESAFIRVQFRRCNFAHTTVNLCSFYTCEFKDGSIDGLDYKAVNYNVFSKCDFDGGVSNETVLSRNFGLKPVKPSSSIIPFGSEITLDQVCLVSGSRHVSAYDIVRAIETECANFHGRMKKLRLEFIANIVRVMASERHIAPGSLVYVEGLLSELGARFLEDGDPQAILAAFVTVRSALFDRVNEILAPNEVVEGIGDKIELEYRATFSHDEGVAFASALDQIVAAGHGAVQLTSIRHGSTIFGIDLTAAIYSATAIVAALNLLLSQANLSIKIIKAIRGEFKRRKSKSRTRRAVTKPKKYTPALVLSGRQPTELIRLRKAIHENGMTLVKLDEPAMITLFVREDGMRVRAD